MRANAKPRGEHSPLAILKELAIEGTSSLVEAQRTLLNLAQQENDILMNGVKERIAGFIPVVAMTDLVQRSLDTFIGMQQDFLTTASKQTLYWLELEKGGKGDRGDHLLDLAREGVENFTRAQKKFLDVVAEEANKVTSHKREHNHKAVRRTELAKVAREAGHAFIEAQKRLLDVMGQQMSVNLDAATRTLELLSPSRLLPIANFTGEGVKSFVDAEKSMIGSLIMPKKQPKVVGKAGQRVHRVAHQRRSA
ncbi:MAG: hypothetical protein LAO24_15605 [Acidobacteriia bacterium]|nr:hypothetical protein [Terriglobia bacterium]